MPRAHWLCFSLSPLLQLCPQPTSTATARCLQLHPTPLLSLRQPMPMGRLLSSLLQQETEVERYICDDIALAVPSCAIASSKWNSESGQDSCVVRILEIPDPCFPPTFEKSKEVQMIIYKAKGNAILNMSERKSKEYKEELLGEFHASIMVTLRDSIARASLLKMETGDPGFTECFKHLALGLSLFSFTLIETPAQPADVPMEDAAPTNDGDKEQIKAPTIEEKPFEGNCSP